MTQREEYEAHCWENGPETEDGWSTTCMLIDGHKGQHEWTRDDQISISFPPSQKADHEALVNDCVELLDSYWEHCNDRPENWQHVQMRAVLAEVAKLVEAKMFTDLVAARDHLRAENERLRAALIDARGMLKSCGAWATAARIEAALSATEPKAGA